MGQVETFEYRLAGMRKPDRFIVYKRLDDGSYLAQGDRTIVRVQRGSCRAIINWRGSGYKTRLHLSPALGAEVIDVPAEFVGLVVEFAPGTGDTIGTSCVRLA